MSRGKGKSEEARKKREKAGKKGKKKKALASPLLGEASAPHSHVRAEDLLKKKRGRPPTLPHCIAVPSAQAGLTSLFGMGRGGAPPQ